MGGQYGQRAAGDSERSSGGGGASSPVAEYGSNEFMAAYLAATRSPKKRCEERWNGGGLDIHTPTVDGFQLDTDFGAWCTEDGEEAVGFDGNLSFLEHEFQLPGHEIGVSGPNANAQFGWLGDQLSVGGQANLAEAKYSSTDDWSANRDDDDQFGFGLSLGVGAAGRFHHSDKDHDGHDEWGFGFDAGPVSFDYKTETPVRDALLFALTPALAITWALADSIIESIWGDDEEAMAADLSDVRGSPEPIGPSTSVAYETVPPLPAAAPLPANSVFQPAPSPLAYDAHPGSVFGRR